MQPCKFPGRGQRRKGFTLIQISILLTAAALVLVTVLPSSRSTLTANSAATVKLNAVFTALREFEAAHSRLPCPADASQPIGSASYGQEALNPGPGTNCAGGAPAANYVDAANNVAIGMVPVQALALSNDYALDAYGRDITYAVDTNATACFGGTLAGKITVTDNGAANSTVVALVSHGVDGHGAWLPLAGGAGAAVRLNAGSTDADQLTNAHVDGAFAPTAVLNNFVTHAPTATFDDLIAYKSSLWNMNKAPASASALIPSLTPPANGSYYTGQAVPFIMTFGNTVTVTGAPRLTLTVGQAGGGTTTRYANFASSLGNTATFNYIVQSSDYAPSGISMASPISLNGGTIAVGGAPACLSFTPPSLSAVLINPASIYVADQGNNRVQIFDGNFTYQGQMGCAGTSACAASAVSGGFKGPKAIAVDASGNLWVVDNPNNRVEQFTRTGTFLQAIGAGYNGVPGAVGASGNLSGQFNQPNGVAVDGAGNVWVTDGANNRVQEFNGATGAFINKFGSGGATNGKFNTPYGIAIDGSGAIWVADVNNNRVQKFDAGFTYQGQFPYSIGTGNPEGIAIDTGGNIWVTGGMGNPVGEYTSGGTYLAQYNFGTALGVGVDGSGNVWTADFSTPKVGEFSNCGTAINQWGAGGPGSGQFSSPSAIAFSIATGFGGACITSVTPPANGNYNTGQTLTFSVAYNAVVTVSGTPRLVLTIGGNTRYAMYVSGSGTSTLTFQYVVQGGDTATSVALATAVDANGGGVTGPGGKAASLNYTPPPMAITFNSAPFILVADSSNNRVQRFDLSGNYMVQFGSPGPGNGQFSTPADTAVDGSGNIWVTDFGNNRVQEFDSSRNYLSSVGTGGVGNGQFTGPDGIAVDTSNNIWVTDYQNHRVEKFDSSGAFKLAIGAGYNGAGGVIGTAGAGNGQFKHPVNVRLDFGGNVYVSEFDGSRLQKFDTLGNFIKAFGPAVPNYGTFNLLTDFGFDACRNIWVEDQVNGKAVELDYAGNYVSSFSGIGIPRGLGIDASGKLYLLDNAANAVNVYNASGALLSSFGTGGVGNGQFNSPFGLTIVGSSPTALPLTSCPAVILGVTGPAGGTYSTGQALNFTVTYDQAVTVTGTPRIALTVGGNARQAAYAGGSGGATLTFSYTLVAGDAPGSALTLASTIALNGGTLTNGGLNAGLNFTPPNLAAVVIGLGGGSCGAPSFYIADSTNHRIRMVDGSGNICTVAGNGTQGYSGDGGPATSAMINIPPGMAVDSAGNLYFADYQNNRVRKVAAGTGTITTVAGNGTGGFSGDGGPATGAMVNSPYSVALDSSGNLYIADFLNNRIRKVDTLGVITTIAGTGAAGFSGDGGPATSAKLFSPQGVAVDGSGNLYIGDATNNRIREVAAGTGIITTVAGNGTLGFGGDGGPATSAMLNTPYIAAVDSANNLYIADYGNNAIRKVTAGVITTVAGNGTAGYSGDGGPAISAKLNSPPGVAVDSSGNLYIADYLNQRIRKVDVTGKISTVAGNGTLGYSGDGGPATGAKLYNPQSVAVPPPSPPSCGTPSYYIADSSNQRVRVVDASGNICTVAGTGVQGYGGDGGPATSAKLSNPYSAAVDSAGNLYISEAGNNRIRKVDHTTGIITTFAGTGTAGFSGDGGPATGAKLNQPLYLVFDGAGNLYLADWFNSRIRRIDHATGIITTVAGNGTAGFSGDGGPATSAGLLNPEAVWIDSAGNLYITDTGNQRIRKVDGTGTITTVAGNGTAGFSGDGGPATGAMLWSPLRITVDSSGNLYIADALNNRVRKVDHTTGIITTVAGTGAAGYSGDGGPATSAKLHLTAAVTLDSAGNLYITDSINNVIRKVAAGTGIITTVAGYGTAGFSGDGGPAASAELTGPYDVALKPTSGSGGIYIADIANNVVRKVDTAGNISTFAGTGALGYSGDGGPATSAQLNHPTGLAVDNIGNVYIADKDNYRIRKVDTAGNISTFAGNGVYGYSGDGGPATSAELGLDWPSGMTVDSAGNLYFADPVNNVVRKVATGTGIISSIAGNHALGEGYTGDGGAATSARLCYPTDVAVDSVGNIYIADSYNHVIRKVDTLNNIYTIAGNGSGAICTGSPAFISAFSGDGGPATSAQLAFPYSISLDSAGNLYIADVNNNRIRKVNTTSGIISTVAGNGVSGYSGDGGLAVNAGMYPVAGIALDSADNIYITDFNNSRVRIVNTSNIISTIAGNGTQGYSGDGGPATSAKLNLSGPYPAIVAVGAR